jgi:hypothetical protein
VFQPVYYTLIQVLLQKVQYPDEQEFESWTKGTSTLWILDVYFL